MLADKRMKEIQSKTTKKENSGEEKFRDIINRISDPVIAIDLEGNYTYVNKRAEQILGRPLKELIGKSIWNESRESNSLQLKEACKKAIAKQEYVYLEQFSTLHKMWFGNHIYPSPEGITITFRDITKRKKKEEDYNKIAQRNALILDTMLDNFSLTDEDLNIIDVNPSFCKTTGYTRTELLKMNLCDLEADLTRDEVKQTFRNAVEKGNILLDTRKKKKNGEIIDVELTITEMNIAGRNYFASFGRDISDYKKAEAQIKNEKKLSDSIINSLPGLFYLFNEKGKFLRWNKNVETVSGYSYEELASMHPLDLYKEDEKELIAKKIKEVFEKGRAEIEAHLYTKNKEKIPYYFTGWVTDIEGNNCLIGTGIDITQLTKAKEALHQMEQEVMEQKVLEQKKISRAIINTQEKERNYIGRELHDNVNQLLASTRLYLGLASKDNEKAKELIKYPMELLDSAIEEIRSLTHKHVAPLQNMDIEQSVTGLMNLLKKSTGIQTKFEYNLKCEISDDLKVNIYRILQEGVSNIIRHAKATKASVLVKDHEDKVIIEIKDNGKGFDVNQKREGIGLSNITNRINSFNGDLSIESSTGKGCSIKIQIPY
jgi:PAS domain S-box-containing protein